jgi:hypothetical protein
MSGGGGEDALGAHLTPEERAVVEFAPEVTGREIDDREPRRLRSLVDRGVVPWG